MGADLPKDLMPPKQDNQAGFWESKDLEKIHDEMLSAAGSSWDDWSAFSSDWIGSDVARGFKERLLQFLRDDFGSSKLFVIKDPRICRFIPLWLEILKNFGAKTRIVIPVRNPLEVAASLNQRNGLSPEKSYLMWLRHMLDAEHETRSLPRAIVHYDSLVKNSQKTVQTILDRAKLSFVGRSNRATLEIDRFVSISHRHHMRDENDLRISNDVIEWVHQAYSLFSRMALGSDSPDVRRELDKVRIAFHKVCATFGVICAETQLKALNTLETERKHFVEKLDAARVQENENENDRARLVATLEEKAATSARVEAHNASLSIELTAVRERARAAEEAVEQHERALINARSEAEATRTKLHASENELADFRSKLAETEKELKSNRSYFREAQIELLRAHREIVIDVKRYRNDLAIAQQEAQQRAATAEAQINELGNKLAESQREAQQRHTELAWLRDRLAENERDVQRRESYASALHGEIAELKTALATARRVGQAVINAMKADPSLAVADYPPLGWRQMVRRMASPVKVLTS
jgi:hypothetical protein